jgi:hypothetical protein
VEMRVAVKEKVEQCPPCAEPATCGVLGQTGIKRMIVFESKAKFGYRVYSASKGGLGREAPRVFQFTVSVRF